MKNLRKRHYSYTITLDVQIPPRKLASYLIGESATMSQHLKQVVDLQRNDHIYGSTYRVGAPIERQIVANNVKRVHRKWYNVFLYATKN